MALLIGFASLPALTVPVLFGAMGFVSGMAGPSRDLLVKKSTPDNATGRVYGVVYAGLDIGQAVVPLLIGSLMDQGAYRSVWLALALVQGVLIVSAFNVRRARRTVFAPALTAPQGAGLALNIARWMRLTTFTRPPVWLATPSSKH